MSAPLQLPAYVGAVSSWSQVDWLDRSWASKPADSTGVVTLALDQLADNTRWRITHAVVSSASTSASSARLYRDGVSVGNLRSGSNSGNYDEADYPLGLWIPQGSALVVQWTGVSAGAVCTLALQADILRLAGTT